MEENNSIKINLVTILLIIAIIIISIMAYFILKISDEKTNTEQKMSELNEEVIELEKTINTMQSAKKNTTSNTINTNDNTNSTTTNHTTEEIKLDKEYRNNDYGITFSYPASFSNHENSLKEDLVETLTDDKNNQIVIVRSNSNITLEEEINFQKTTTKPDGSLFNTNIKEDGNVTLKNGTTGYRMEMNADGKDVIKIIVQKDNDIYNFSFVTDNNEEPYEAIFNKIINTIAIQ